MVMSLHFRVMVKIGQCHIYAAMKYILDAESVVKLLLTLTMFGENRTRIV